MDKLADQLKQDAGRIDVEISDELERRIDASLQGVTPLQRTRPTQRSAVFWWASSLTGVALALLVVVLVNVPSRPEPASQLAGATPTVALPSAAPVINWKAESAMLTSPLRQELADLQSDLKKAELKVREDIGL